MKKSAKGPQCRFALQRFFFDSKPKDTAIALSQEEMDMLLRYLSKLDLPNYSRTELLNEENEGKGIFKH